MAPPLRNLVGLGILVTFTSALVTVTFNYDCRRPGSGCKDLQGNNSDALCSKEKGSCTCLNNTQGYDCSVNSSTVNAGGCNNCGVGGVCVSDKCHCNESSYGSNCENERANLWCNGNEMFINIYPHGDFTGNMFVTMDDNKGGGNCNLPNVANVNLTAFNLFKVGTNPIPKLEGFYINLKHFNETCGDASTSNNNSRTSFIRRVAVQYSTVLISSLDQVITFNCTILNDNSTTATTSIVAGVPSINDYNQVNVEEKIEPVTFEVTYGNGSKINQNVTLGAALRLVFNLTQGSLYTAFKVAFCNATNAQSGTDEKSITFLKDDCPTPNSAMLYRGEVAENNNAGLKQVIIPINAFKFVGAFDQVAFTCTVNLCTDNVASCQKKSCTVAASGDSQATNTTITNTTTTNTPTTNSTITNTTTTNATTTNTPTTNTTTTNTTTTNTTETNTPTTNTTTINTTTAAPLTTAPPDPGRQKRAADVSPTTKDLTKSISVTTSSSPTDTGVSAQNTTVEEEDFCMQKMEVIVIIVTFSVALIVMIILVLVLVMRLVKSRVKVVDAPKFSGEANRYNLPRLSLATT